MGPIKFYWEAVKLAFRHSLDHTQYVLFIVFLIVGAAGYFIPKLANWETTVTGPEAALIVLGGIVMARLLLAPYWLYKEKADEVAKFSNIAPVARLLAVATAFQDEIVRRRLNTAEARLSRGDAQMMVEMIDRERIRCPDLMNADKNTLSIQQVESLSRYQARERELEMCVDGIEKRQDEHRANPMAAAIDFRNRLSYLVTALDGLIESLRA